MSFPSTTTTSRISSTGIFPKDLPSSPPTSPPRVDLTFKDKDALGRLDFQSKAHVQYQPPLNKMNLPALELRFASRSIGDTSYQDLSFEDVIQGKQVFIQGLSRFSDNAIRKAFLAKMHFKNAILRRIMLCQANIDAAAYRMEFFEEMKKEAAGELEAADEVLEWVKRIMNIRHIDHEDLAFHRATYADELVALTIADMQLDQMANVLRDKDLSVDKDKGNGVDKGKDSNGVNKGIDYPSDADDSDTTGSDVEDDLVYEDDQ